MVAPPALGRIVEFHGVLPQGDVFAQQGGEPVGLILLGIRLSAGAEVAEVQQLQRQHPLAREPATGRSFATLTRQSGSRADISSTRSSFSSARSSCQVR